MENPVLIFGATEVAKMAYDIFEQNGVVVYGFLDDDQKLHGSEIGTVSVLGSTDDDGFLKLIGQKCEAFVSIEHPKARKKVVEMLHERRQVQPVNAVHKTTIISPLSHIGHGNLIASGTIINPFVEVGNHCLLHGGVVIDTQANVGDFVQIGIGAKIGSNVKIAEGAYIGAGAVLVNGIEIGKNARIGAGSVVVESVESNQTVFGNPAKKV